MSGAVLQVTVLVFSFFSLTSLVDEKTLQKLDDRKSAHNAVVEKARLALLEAFERTISQVQKQNGSSAEQRVKIADALQAEKSEFNNSGRIPFSPMMREHAIKYLASVNKSALPLAKAYQAQIDRALRSGNDNVAKDLLEQQEDLVFVVGIWDCYGENFRRGEKFTWTLYSDFTVNRANDANDALPKGWSFQQNGGLLIKNFSPGAPKGGFTDKCSVSWDGVLFEAKNQLGGVYTGRLQ
jgi:hypothetical protein